MAVRTNCRRPYCPSLQARQPLCGVDLPRERGRSGHIFLPCKRSAAAEVAGVSPSEGARAEGTLPALPAGPHPPPLCGVDLPRERGRSGHIFLPCKRSAAAEVAGVSPSEGARAEGALPALPAGPPPPPPRGGGPPPRRGGGGGGPSF